MRSMKNLLGAAAALALASCAGLPTAKQAGLHLPTERETLPAGLELQWASQGRAHELLNPVEMVVVLSGGSNPMPADEWEKYSPPFPWQRNIERHLLFESSAFLHSPNGRIPERTFSGHTWIEIAKPLAVDFIPAGQKTDLLKPAPGHLVVKTILKPHLLRFTGSIWRLTDNRGNFYVMHATEADAPSGDVALPAGWTLEKVDLAEPLVIAPSQGGWYNVVGDCLGQGYHQYVFADAAYPAGGTP